MINYVEDPHCMYHFWGLTEMRDFCRSLGSRINRYEDIGTAPALKRCVELTMKYLFHCQRATIWAFATIYLRFPFALEWINKHLISSSGTGRKDPMHPMEYESFPELYHLLADVFIKFRVASSETNITDTQECLHDLLNRIDSENKPRMQGLSLS